MANATSTAFCRTSTTSGCQQSGGALLTTCFPVLLLLMGLSVCASLTYLAIAYYVVQRADEVREYGVDVIEARQDRYYVRARVGVLLGENRGEEDAECLVSRIQSASSHLRCNGAHSEPAEGQKSRRATGPSNRQYRLSFCFFFSLFQKRRRSKRSTNIHLARADQPRPARPGASSRTARTAPSSGPPSAAGRPGSARRGSAAATRGPA